MFLVKWGKKRDVPGKKIFILRTLHVYIRNIGNVLDIKTNVPGYKIMCVSVCGRIVRVLFHVLYWLSSVHHYKVEQT